MPQATSFSNRRQFLDAVNRGQSNDNNEGILSHIYDDDIPHPYFDPTQIGFYRYRNYTHKDYAVRSELPDKSIVFEDFEMYLPGVGDLDHKLTYNINNCPLTERDYLITACITKNDHMWTVPYVYNNYHFVQTHEVNRTKWFKRFQTGRYCADILLGNPKPHRSLFFNLLQQHNMLDKNIVNLFGVYKSSFLDEIDDGIQETIDNTTLVNGYANTTTHLKGNFVSQHISEPIMENSWYSVVAETVTNNDCFFVTEKTAKPLMAGRPFIMLGGQHYLKRLRSLGFKTFAPVIDESYDEIADEQNRIVAAFKSFQQLSRQDPITVKYKISDVLEHNQRIMYSKQLLTQRARDFLDNVILDHSK